MSNRLEEQIDVWLPMSLVKELAVMFSNSVQPKGRS